MRYALSNGEGKTLLFLLPLSDRAPMVGPCLFLWIRRINLNHPNMTLKSL